MPTPPYTTRRKSYLIGADYAQSIFSRGLRQAEWFEVPQPLNLPETARVCGFWYDASHHAFRMVVEDPSFDEVPEGLMLPEELMVFGAPVRLGPASKQMEERIALLEETLSDLYHHHDLTSRAMQRIHDVLPQGEGPAR